VAADIDKSYLLVECDCSSIALPYAEPQVPAAQFVRGVVNFRHERACDAAAMGWSINVEAVKLRSLVLRYAWWRKVATDLRISDEYPVRYREQRNDIWIDELLRLLRNSK